MKNPEKLIGRKVKGFDFKEQVVGKIGVITHYDSADDTFCVSFENVEIFYYPADQIEAHLVEEENEIPTLSDGVMMLVSLNNREWFTEEVFAKSKDGTTYYSRKENYIVSWAYCKPIEPIEPTKEEQLIKILGSADKVAEIMELFNDKK